MKLKSKLLILFIPLSVLACLSLLILTKKAIHGVVVKEVAARALLKTEPLEVTVAKGLVSRNELMILAALQGYMSRIGAAYAVALDSNGVVMAHSNVAEKGKTYRDSPTLFALAARTPKYQEIVREAKPMLDIAIPIRQLSAESDEFFFGEKEPDFGKQIGAVRVGIPLQDAIRTENNIVRRFSWIMLAILAIAVTFALFLLNRILLPVRFLSKATEDITKGHYDVHVPVLSGDELSELAKRFNLMSGALNKRTTELSRSNQELEQFAYIASHDLQEPLRMVSSFVQLLALSYKGKLGKDADEYINFALDGSRRMKSLIDALLAYARVGSRAQHLQVVDFSAAVEDALKNLKMALQETRGIVTVEKLPPLKADRIQITALFQNLIGNALKFRADAPPRVEISSRPASQEQIFSVRDNGIGIDPQYFEKIFVIFQRLQDRQKYPGTGVGLAICKKIVLWHGGRIWVESRPGEGSTFFFTIPKGGKNES